jgi:hypothetical protein
MSSNQPLPDFYRAETPVRVTPKEALFTNNSVLLLAFGLLAGLFAGFSLGVSAQCTALCTTLVSGR